MNKQGRRRKTEGGISSRPSRCAHLSFPLPPSSFRLGTTLIELLITITIIAILSATFLGVSNLAMESAKEARTKTTLGKINSLLMEKWNSYATRRVDVSPIAVQNIKDDIELNVPPNQQKRALGKELAGLRLWAVRELIKLEMPDRWSDVVSNAIPDANPRGVTPPVRPLKLAAFPAITRTYQRRLAGLKDKIDGIDITGDDVRRNQGAECLYMIIMLTTGDGEARTLFNEQDIGDTDGDGAPEFLDGWGQPIAWIRWPVGFVSDLMPIDPVTNDRRYDADHDPLDYFRLDLNAFRITPLVFSRGADGVFDIASVTEAVTSLDPYVANGSPAVLLGTQRDKDNDGENWIDNIHNHLLDNK